MLAAIRDSHESDTVSVRQRVPLLTGNPLSSLTERAVLSLPRRPRSGCHVDHSRGTRASCKLVSHQFLDCFLTTISIKKKMDQAGLRQEGQGAVESCAQRNEPSKNKKAHLLKMHFGNDQHLKRDHDTSRGQHTLNVPSSAAPCLHENKATKPNLWAWLSQVMKILNKHVPKCWRKGCLE